MFPVYASFINDDPEPSFYPSEAMLEAEEDARRRSSPVREGRTQYLIFEALGNPDLYPKGRQ